MKPWAHFGKWNVAAFIALNTFVKDQSIDLSNKLPIFVNYFTKSMSGLETFTQNHTTVCKVLLKFLSRNVLLCRAANWLSKSPAVERQIWKAFLDKFWINVQFTLPKFFDMCFWATKENCHFWLGCPKQDSHDWTEVPHPRKTV